MALKKGPKVVLVGVVIVGGIFGLRTAMQKGLIPTPGIMKSIVATRVTLPPQQDAQVANVVALPYPSTAQASVSAQPMTFDIWEWNAMFAAIYANGAATTTKGSLNEKYNVNLTLHREDSNTQMKADLLACAKQLHDGATACSTGAEGIIVMGDSGGQWLADLNPQLKKLGDQAIIVGAVGRSNGEDALLGPQEWKTSPQTMRGKTVVGVIRDGDWNIALNYEGSNGLKNNPDLKTYDPDAVNWIAAPDEDYIKAVTEVFVPNRCEDRKVVKDGKPTGETKNVCPDGVVTWTPGDEQAIHGRPGTVKVISSHEYAAQMPAVLIVLKKFANVNRDEITGFFAANFQAADQVKAFPTVREKAGDISAKVYGDQNGAYWTKYYSGFKDPSGQMLGGSAVFNLEDDLNYFGLSSGHNNNMKGTYEIFGKIAAANYPDLFKGDHVIPPYSQAVDPSFITAAQALLNSSDAGTGAAAEQTDYSAQAASGEVRGKKAVYVQFATGSDQILPSSIPALNELKDSLAINSALALQVDGFTDNTGSDTVNIPLSQKRAEAVKRYFQSKAPQSFPDSRFAGVSGHGSQSPIASNDTANGKALNRRVEISQIGQ
jgi:OOP family OmpA-OmpF porin